MVDYETIIGFECHSQLKTATKLFCGCSTVFGAEPNSQTCPICLGMPGVLPVMNRKAFELALKTAIALNCEVPPVTVFDRKNYYYPDLPKNFQTSQNYHPLGRDGVMDIEVNGELKQIGIDNVHLEEDAGKLIHPEGSGANKSHVDLNRAGTPLLEIVTKPELRSIDEARACMEAMRQLLIYLDVSDCKMQEGSLRFEPSISIRPFDQKKLGNRVEIKNVNSVRFVVSALEFEIARQAEILDSGGTVKQETALFDETRNETRPMRTKEYAEDYRYFPEPDLVPNHLSRERLEEVKASLPELPLARRQRFLNKYGLPEYDAGVLVGDPGVADYFEECTRLHSDFKSVSNLVMNDILRELGERRIEIGEFTVSPEAASDLLERVAGGEVNKNQSREVFAEMVETGKSAGDIIEEKGLRQIGDEDTLSDLVKESIANNPQAADEYRAGKKKAKGALVGPIMQATKGKANPQVINQLIDELLSES